MIKSISYDDKSIIKGSKSWMSKQTSIRQAEEIPGLIIVREDYYKHNGSNIYALDFNLKLVWTAELPNESDVFVGFTYNTGILRCQTWNGFLCNIDIATGKLKDKFFTK